MRPSGGGSACDIGDRPTVIVLTVGVTAADACAVSGLCNSEVHWPTAKLTCLDILHIYKFPTHKPNNNVALLRVNDVI